MSALTTDSVVPDVIDTVPKNTIKVNYSGIEVNFGNELTPTQVKDQPLVDWPIEEGVYYTLVMTDPDVPNRENPVTGQIKHWLVINIPGTNVSKGQTLAAYIGSGPRKDSGLHRYIFLVYKQSDIINSTEKSVGNCSREGRIGFKVRDWAKLNNLGEPIAANYYQAQFDDWVPILHSRMT